MPPWKKRKFISRLTASEINKRNKKYHRYLTSLSKLLHGLKTGLWFSPQCFIVFQWELINRGKGDLHVVWTCPPQGPSLRPQTQYNVKPGGKEKKKHWHKRCPHAIWSPQTCFPGENTHSYTMSKESCCFGGKHKPKSSVLLTKEVLSHCMSCRTLWCSVSLTFCLPTECTINISWVDQRRLRVQYTTP